MCLENDLIWNWVQTNSSLTTVRLNGNKIGDRGGLYFAQALQLNTTLESLDLADTDLVSVVPPHRKLESLDLADTDLVSVVPPYGKLESLDLADTDLVSVVPSYRTLLNSTVISSFRLL